MRAFLVWKHSKANLLCHRWLLQSTISFLWTFRWSKERTWVTGLYSFRGSDFQLSVWREHSSQFYLGQIMTAVCRSKCFRTIIHAKLCVLRMFLQKTQSSLMIAYEKTMRLIGLLTVFRQLRWRRTSGRANSSLTSASISETTKTNLRILQLCTITMRLSWGIGYLHSIEVLPHIIFSGTTHHVLTYIVLLECLFGQKGK